MKSQSDLQRLLQQVDKMSKFKGSSKELLQYYLENVQSLKIKVEENEPEGIQRGLSSSRSVEQNNDEQALNAFKDLFEKLHMLQTEYSKLEKTKRASLPSPPSEIPQSIRKIFKIQNAVIKIQAFWRKVLAMKKLKSGQNLSKQVNASKKSNQSPEETAMREFALQLKSKKLTPEAFFRICDTDYKQSISLVNFKESLQKLNICLTKAQFTRLQMILDEDIEGSITLEEYTNAIEAYGLSCERHRSLDGSAIYHPFDQRCCFKLIKELSKKNISFMEMFNACDVNDDEKVNIQEIRNFIEGLSSNFKLKEIHALMNFIDIDKAGLIEKDSFIQIMTRSEGQMRQTTTINKNIAEKRVIQRSKNNNFMAPVNKIENNNFFETEEVGGGDQNMPDQNPILQQNPNQKSVSLSPDDLRRKQIIQGMEKDGIGFTSFFNQIRSQVQNGLISLGTILKAIEKNYPSTTISDRNFLIKECIKDRTKIDFYLFEELFTKFSKNLQPSSAQTFQTIVTNIIKKMGLSPQESLKQFFKAQNLTETDLLSDVEFTQIFSRIIQTTDSTSLSQAFQSLNLDQDGFIFVRDLCEVLLSYISQSGIQQSQAISQSELKKLVPGIDVMSPRTRSQNIIEYVQKQLQDKAIKPLSVYKMADPSNTGLTSALNLEASFKKILPLMRPEVINEIMIAFKVKQPKDIIKRQDFEAVFQEDKALISNSDSAKTQIPAKAKNEDEAMSWIKKLDSAFLREGLSPLMAFKASDTNQNGVITMDELRESIKKLIPEDSISFMDLKKIIMSFDTNRNGTIDQQEFIAQIEKARNSLVPIPETKPAIQQNKNEEKKAQVQENDNQQRIKPNDQKETLSLVVDKIDEKVNFKKIFGDIPINEQGKILIPHIARRFKSEQAADGTSLKPSDYLPVIKALDTQNTGTVDTKDLVIFLDRYCRTNTMDCLLELRYMANFIEFQMLNRNTRQFFENNSKLRNGSRLMEVEVMSELNKLFSISMSMGNAIYKKLAQVKGDINFTLDDLCSLIDDQRLVKVEQLKPQTEAQKLDPLKLIESLKYKISVLPKRIQAEISQKLYQVDLIEQQIPYKDFYLEFVEENQLISSTESKAIYQYIKGSQPFINYKSFQNLGLVTPQASTQQKLQPEEKKQLSAPSNPPQQVQKDVVDKQLLVKTIEEQINMPLEKAIDEILTKDQILVYELNKKIASYSSSVEKKYLVQLAQQISKSNAGKLSIKEIILFFMSIQGKYSQYEVLQEILSDLEEPIQKSLIHLGLQPNQAYNCHDFTFIITSMPGLTNFKALSLFYDLNEQEDEIFGSALLNKLTLMKPQQMNTGTNSLRKQVTFSDPSSDETQIKALCSEFIKEFARISTEKIITSALNNFSQALKQFKTLGDAVSKFDSSGQGNLHIDWFRKRLNDINTLSNDEKIVLTFIPIDKTKQDIYEINIIALFKLLRTLPSIEKPIITANTQKLQQNFEAILKLVEPQSPMLKQGTLIKDNSPANQPIQKLNTALNKRKSGIEGYLGIIQQNLKDSQKKADLIQFFKEQNNEVQYIEFYDHLELNWGVTFDVDNTELLEREIDIQNSGHFRLNDLIRFCTRFGVDLGVRLDTMKDTFKRKPTIIEGKEVLTCGKLQYQILPERDFYKGISTILTSEEAALVICEKIYKELKDEEEFYDHDFGPQSVNDQEGSAKAMYFTGQQPPGYPDPELIEWLRPEDYSDQKPMFIDDGASANDVKQGRIGNCWFVSALSVLATRDELLRGGIGAISVSPAFKATQETALFFSKGVYPPLFHIYRKKGLYVFRFFKNFKWLYVIIDDRIPCQSSRPVFGSCKSLHELWVPLIEKAYAKLHGCYESLISGFIDDALSDLTGFVAEKLQLHDRLGNFPHKNLVDKDKFWNFIQERKGERCLMGCSRSNAGEMEVEIDGEKTGIIGGHAYGLMDAFEVPDENATNQRGNHRLMRVRNPWGQKEWNGKWSDRSQELEDHRDLLQKYVDQLEDKDEQFVLGEEDGTFLINYKNFRTIFNNMYVCVDFPENWSGIRYFSEWDENTSGGIPTPMNEENRVRWAKNPQYCIENVKKKYTDLEVFISLGQIDGRGQYYNGQPIKFPFTEVINPIIFTIMELPQGQKKLERFDEKLIKGVSVVKEHKEVSLRLKLGPGKFVIIPSCSKPQETGSFILSIYFNKPKGGLHFQRLDQPQNNNYQLIMEEQESALQVQDWKIDLCQKRITGMIFDEDFSLTGKSFSNTVLQSGNMKLSSVMERATTKKASPKIQLESDNPFTEEDDLSPI